VKQYSDFFALKAPILMRLVTYDAGCSCGIRSCGSISIGIVDGDTIRVLTPCNSDTTFYVGMYVKVSPLKKPLVEPIYILSYIDDGTIDVLPIHRRRFKTCYGKIEHTSK
jgi:hypothetical protein